MYHAIVIKESLADKSALDQYKILKTKVSDRWHLHVVEVPEPKGFISNLQKAMTDDQPYYFHVYDNDNFLEVAFKDKIFQLNSSDKSTWLEAQKYGGEKLNIPPEELDFIPNNFAAEDEWLGSTD